MDIAQSTQLQPGQIISYLFPSAAHPSTNQLWHGRIIHVGQGLAARYAVWVMALDGMYQGQIEFILLEQIVGIEPIEREE